jgi:hypothetical protein
MKSSHKRKVCYGNGYCGSVWDSNTWGYVNRSGEFVIEDVFEDANSFSEGMGLVVISRSAEKNSGKYVFINKNQRLAINEYFIWARTFSEGLAAAKMELGNNKVGFIDRSGRFVIGPQFRDARDFKEGLAPVQLKDGKWVYIDKSGQIKIDGGFLDAEEFSEKYAAVELKGGKWVFIDKFGAVAIRPRFDIGRAEKVEAGVAIVDIGRWESYRERVGKRMWVDRNEWIAKAAYMDIKGEMLLPGNCRQTR